MTDKFKKKLLETINVYEVDGAEIRTEKEVKRLDKNPEYTLGGHHWRYPDLMKEDEIFMENIGGGKIDSNVLDFCADLVHEEVEREIMRLLGWSYENAHDAADVIESYIRKNHSEKMKGEQVSDDTKVIETIHTKDGDWEILEDEVKLIKIIEPPKPSLTPQVRAAKEAWEEAIVTLTKKVMDGEGLTPNQAQLLEMGPPDFRDLLKEEEKPLPPSPVEFVIQRDETGKIIGALAKAKEK